MLAPITTNDTEHEDKVDADEYFNDNKTEVIDAQQSLSIETIQSPEYSTASKQQFAELNESIKNLKDVCTIEINQIERENYVLDDVERRHKEELNKAEARSNELCRQQITKEKQWITIKAEIDRKYNAEREVHEKNLRVALEQNTKLTDDIQQKEQRKEILKQIEKCIKIVAYRPKITNCFAKALVV